MAFPVVMYGCKSWTTKKAECLRIDAFELWCWRRLLRDPWTTRRLNQSILKEISPEYSLEGLILGWSSNTLATWYEELTHLKTPRCLERLMVGGEGDNRRWDGWMASPTQWTWVWVSSRSWWWTGRLSVLQSMGSQKVRYDWVTELTSSIFSFFSLSAFVSNRDVLVLALDFSRFLTSVSLKFHVFQHLHLVLAIQTVPTYNPDLHSHVSMTLKTFLLGPRITSKSHVQNQILHLPVTFWK